MPLSPKATAIKDLRDAYLRLKYILCLNELEEDQDWIERHLTTSARKISRMLRLLEPGRRLPSVLHDTRLGRTIKEARKEQKRWARCKHDLKPYIPSESLRWGLKWERCRKCTMTRSVPTS